MAKEDGYSNLKPLNTLPKEEQREIQKKGNKASTKVRQQKAKFKKAVEWLANSDYKPSKGGIVNFFKKNGIDIEGLTPTQLATMGLWIGAVYGNASNYKTLMEANSEIDSEERETPSVTVNIVDNSDLEKAMYEEEVDNETIQSK